MGTNGSNRRTVVMAVLALPLVGVSWVFMQAVLGLALRQGFQLKPSLMLAEAALVAPGLLLAWLLSEKGLRATLGIESSTTRTLGLAALAGLTLWVASMGLMEIQSSFWAPPPGYVELFRQIHAALAPKDALDALFSVAAIALAPALCEELLFRGVVLPSLARWIGPAAGIVVSASLFGAIHIDAVGTQVTAYRVPFALAVGLALGLLRMRTASLWPAIAAHATLNTATLVLAQFLDDPLADEQPGDARLGAALLLAGVVASALVFRAMRSPAPVAKD